MTTKIGRVQVDALYDQNGDPVLLPIPAAYSPVVQNYVHSTGPGNTLTFAGLDVNAYGLMTVSFGFHLAVAGNISLYFNGDVTAADYRNRGSNTQEATLSVVNSSSSVIIQSADANTGATGIAWFPKVSHGNYAKCLYQTGSVSSGPQFWHRAGTIILNAAPANITSISFVATQNFQNGDHVLIMRSIA
jgi:hypothetical protein